MSRVSAVPGFIAAMCALSLGCGEDPAERTEGQPGAPDDPSAAAADAAVAQMSDPEPPPLPQPRDVPMSACGDCQVDLVGVGTGMGFELGNPNENVAIDPVDGALVVDAAGDVLGEYIWVADTNLPGVVKIDLTTMQITGHYYTGGGSTSRTTINSLGEAFVASRTNGPNGDYGVTKILPGGQDCPDTNGDGVITTSTGEGDLLAWGEDDCVIWHTELEGDARGMAAQDISGVAGAVCEAFVPGEDFAADEVTDRGSEHYVWVGGLHRQIYKLDASTGEILVQIESPEPVYGAALDADGRFWIGKTLSYVDTLRCTDSATCDAEPVCGDVNDWETFDQCVDDGAVKARKRGTAGYGITVDCKQRVWMSSTTQRYDPALPLGARHESVGGVAGSGAGGIAVDAQGYVWASSGAQTTRLDSDTLDAVKVAAPNKGVAVAPDGRVLTVRGTGLHVIEPGVALGDAVVQQDALTLPGTAYAYSDMTGVQTRLANGEPGTYSQIFEVCDETQEVDWEELLFDADVPDGTWARFLVRSAATPDELAALPFVTVGCSGPGADPQGAGDLAGMGDGRFLEVKVQLSATSGEEGQRGCGGVAASARIRSFGPAYTCVTTAPE